MPLEAFGFSEDLCVDQESGQIVNCLTDDKCNPFLGPTPRCRVNLLFDGAAAIELATKEQARSIVHVDVTHFLAQAIGLTPRAAYWIAAYNEVTDIGSYSPFGIDGKVVHEDPELGPVTAIPFNGWTRTYAYTSAWSYHIPAPFKHEGEELVPDCNGDLGRNEDPNMYRICGAKPDLNDTVHEGNLVHYRDWALGYRPSGEGEHGACAAGLTVADGVSNYSGPTCYKDDPELLYNSSDVTKYIKGRMPILRGLDMFALPFEAFTGRQIAKFTPPDRMFPMPRLPKLRKINPDLMDVRLADNLVDIVVEETTPSDLTAILSGKSVEEFTHLIRMGVYLHVLQDRISHHICGDISSVTGPDASGRFTYGYDGLECGQDMHSYYHFQEIGQRTLPLRTTSSIEYVFDELMAFAEKFPTWADGAPEVITSAYREKVVADVSAVLLVPEGCERVKAMIELVDSYGFTQMPGNSVSNAQLDAMCAGSGG